MQKKGKTKVNEKQYETYSYTQREIYTHYAHMCVHTNTQVSILIKSCFFIYSLWDHLIDDAIT